MHASIDCSTIYNSQAIADLREALQLMMQEKDSVWNCSTLKRRVTSLCSHCLHLCQDLLVLALQACSLYLKYS